MAHLKQECRLQRLQQQDFDIRNKRMTRYTNRAKAIIFVVVAPRNDKLTSGTVGDGTQSEYNSKRKVSNYHRP